MLRCEDTEEKLLQSTQTFSPFGRAAFTLFTGVFSRRGEQSLARTLVTCRLAHQLRCPLGIVAQESEHGLLASVSTVLWFLQPTTFSQASF